jgi:hypothetical protein
MSFCFLIVILFAQDEDPISDHWNVFFIRLAVWTEALHFEGYRPAGDLKVPFWTEP